ncbi:GNAT family N-acetyltransferase [Nocardioides sp. HB32]
MDSPIMISMDDRSRFLAAYDEQLRTDAETPSAVSVAALRPLRLVTFSGGRGFVTYQDLGGADADAISRLVEAALAHYGADPEITRVEWKTRGHDYAPGLHQSLLAHGFVAEEAESIMIGQAQRLAVEVPLPEGVMLRQVSEESDVRAMSAMGARAFGDQPAEGEAMADALLRRLSLDDGMELWVAEHNGQIVSAGRLEPVPGTDFAGIWGGSTLEEWRGRGIYRALTAARARSALRRGKTLINSDSTEYSRPILERYGFLKVSTTTPYLWRR